jgi:hypothetical protein
MAISSINIQVSTLNSFAHNDRTSKVTYTISGSENNEYDRSAIEAQAYYLELKKEATENYKNRTGQRLQTKEEKFRWTAVVNLNAGHTLEHVKKLTVELEKKYGWQPLQIAIHKDEGHITTDGKKERNLHAHIEFFMLDKQGLYKFKKKDFRLRDMETLQTFVAQQLKMDRGVSKKESGRERLEHKEYKVLKKAEQAVQEKANIKMQEVKKQLERTTAETVQIKQEFEAFRQKMIQAGQQHTSEQYKKLGSLKKEIIADKKIGFKEAVEMLTKLKQNMQTIQEKNLTEKLITASSTKTLVGVQKVDNNLLKENLDIVFNSINDIVQQAQDDIQELIENLGEKRQETFLKEFNDIKEVIENNAVDKEQATKLVQDYVNYVKDNKKLDWETIKTMLSFMGEMKKEGHNTLGNYKDVWELKEKALLNKIGVTQFKIQLQNLRPKLEVNRSYFIETKIFWRTEFAQKVQNTIKNIESNKVKEGIEDLKQENVLERMMRGLNAMFSKAKRIIKKQKQTILKLRDVIREQAEKIKQLEKDLSISKEVQADMITDEMIIKYAENKFLSHTRITKQNKEADKKTETERNKNKEQEDRVRRR